MLTRAGQSKKARCVAEPRRLPGIERVGSGVHYKILEFCDALSVVRCSLVSRLWNRQLLHDDVNLVIQQLWLCIGVQVQAMNVLLFDNAYVASRTAWKHCRAIALIALAESCIGCLTPFDDILPHCYHPHKLRHDKPPVLLVDWQSYRRICTRCFETVSVARSTLQPFFMDLETAAIPGAMHSVRIDRFYSHSSLEALCSTEHRNLAAVLRQELFVQGWLPSPTSKLSLRVLGQCQINRNKTKVKKKKKLPKEEVKKLKAEVKVKTLKTEETAVLRASAEIPPAEYVCQAFLMALGPQVRRFKSQRNTSKIMFAVPLSVLDNLCSQCLRVEDPIIQNIISIKPCIQIVSKAGAIQPLKLTAADASKRLYALYNNKTTTLAAAAASSSSCSSSLDLSAVDSSDPVVKLFIVP